jgi:hypothetical protein
MTDYALAMPFRQLPTPLDPAMGEFMLQDHRQERADDRVTLSTNEGRPSTHVE